MIGMIEPGTAVPGGPWGGRGSLVKAVTDLELAQKGQSSTPQPHQRTWLGRATEGVERHPSELGLGLSRATSPANVGDRAVGSAAARPPKRPCTAGPAPRSSRPAPTAGRRRSRTAQVRAAGLSNTEMSPRRPASAKPEPPTFAFDSAGFIAAMERPTEVVDTPWGLMPDPPRLRFIAIDDIRGDLSAAQQQARGRVQSAVMPGPQQPPREPDAAPRRPRTAHPLGAPHFSRGAWPCTPSKASPVGTSVANARGAEFAPVRLGAALIRLQRADGARGIAMGAGHRRPRSAVK